MNINPGKLNKKIAIIKRAQIQKTSNGFTKKIGDTSSEAEVVRSCYAQVTNQSGSVLTQSGAKVAEASKRFLIRKGNTDIEQGMIAQYGGHEYEITYVNTYSDGEEYTELLTSWKAVR